MIGPRLRFLARWFSPKSAGVRVGHLAWLAIRRGDAARSKRLWADAARHYHRAVSLEPQLSHIWIQLGHAQHQADDLAAAQRSYEIACSLQPEDMDAHTHLAYLARHRGDMRAAATHLFAALQQQPHAVRVAAEFLWAVNPGDPAQHDMLCEASSFADFALPALPIPTSTLDTKIFIDVSDLFQHLFRSRLPTGIQRVQMEVTSAICSDPTIMAQAIVYAPAQRGWKVLPGDFLKSITLPAEDSSLDAAWRKIILNHCAEACLSNSVEFPKDSVLIDLGSSWARPYYFIDIKETPARYVFLSYDCIPLRRPDWFTPAHVNEFKIWFENAVEAAQGIIAISAATKCDIVSLSRLHRFSIEPDDIEIVHLDGDIRRPITSGTHAKSTYPLQRAEKFVLFVSTIEPRKNHLNVLRAWHLLMHGHDTMPTLVCAGSSGWMNDEVHQFLADHPRLAATVKLLHSVTDSELDSLYRECLFTVYPSFYEGWGLPVTESLCHGKVPATSNAAAVLEAGKGLGAIFDPDNVEEIADVLASLIWDDDHRHRLEKAIRDNPSCRPWRDIGRAMVSKALAITERNMNFGKIH